VNPESEQSAVGEAGPAVSSSGLRGVRVSVPLLRRGVRFYSAPVDQPRARRATDVLLLVPALIGLVLLIVAYPPSGFESSLSTFLASFPAWLDPVWGFLYDLLWLAAFLLLVAVLVSRRWAVVLQVVSAVVLAAVLTIVSTRLALGHWPPIGAALEGGSDAPRFPAVRVAESAAVLLAVSPYLITPLQRLLRWVLALGAVGALFAASVTPGGDLAAFLIALVAASAIRLCFGTSAGRPGVGDVESALRELGVHAQGLEAVERQPAGVFVVRGRDAHGRSLLAKVYGRDAYDSRLLAKAWRTLWYRDAGPAPGLSRGASAEHEAFVTLLAEKAGVPTREVVTAGETIEGDALLVLRGEGQPLASLPADELDHRLLASGWRTLGLLAGANLAHLGIDPETLVSLDGEVGLVDYSGATVSPDERQLQTDRAQLLATTACLAGSERALHAGVEALGKDGVGELLAYLQPPAFDSTLRKALKAASLDVDQLRTQAAELVGVKPPDLVKLRRVTAWTLIQMGLLVLAASAIFSLLGDIDWDTLRSDLADASWGWIAFGFVVAQLPRLTQAVATLGSVAAKLRYGPVYVLQLATCYLNLALPSSLARMAIDIRFFQRQGLPGSFAVTSGLIDSLANNVVQGALIILLLLFTESSISLDLSSPSGGSSNLLWLLVGLVVLAVLIVVLVPRIRRPLVERWREWWPQIRTSLGALRASNKLAMLFGGNIATELLFALALALFVRGLGYHVPYTEILLINESVSLLSTFIPVPGGIGVVEFGLTVGLTSAGMTPESALASVFCYRVSTFYLPPIWGFFAMRWLQQNRYL
jgi:glycosyltransferase 2 family protein